MNKKIDLDSLHEWFLREKRTFPWRGSPSPYAVWISEVMLQQTQAERVVAYFLRWMHHFPTVEHLANSSEEEVIKVWEGLGYYSRARALHASAKKIVTEFSGKIPDDSQGLSKLKGIGPYTQGAILSFAYHKRVSAVDGNVMRVLTRYFEIEEDIQRVKTQENLRKLVLSFLPEKESHITSEALIELGAIICTRSTPQCNLCPLMKGCGAFRNGTERMFPVKAKKTLYETLFRQVALIVHEGFLLLFKELPGKAGAGLWHFPYFETTPDDEGHEMLEKKLKSRLGLLEPIYKTDLPFQKHSYTRFRVTLYPKVFTLKSNKENILGYEWVPFSDLSGRAFSAGHRRIVDDFCARSSLVAELFSS